MSEHPLKDSPLDRSGTCLCGSVRVTVKGAPIVVSICHCTICQRFNGAPFGIQSLHRPSNFFVNKLPEDLWAMPTSKHVTRYRCKECGSPVYAVLGKGKTYVVPRPILIQNNSLGKYDDDEVYRPKHHMHYASRIVDWNDDLPKYIGTSRGELWQGDS